MESFGHKLRENWAVLFAGLVVVFLSLNSALNDGALMPGGDSWVNTPAAPDTTTASIAARTDSTTSTASAGALQFEVVAFRIHQTESGYEARATLDVTNEGTSIARFRPDNITLTTNGVKASPSDDRSFAMDVSPHLSQLVPLTFKVDAVPGARYRLNYANTTIFNGFPS